MTGTNPVRSIFTTLLANGIAVEAVEATPGGHVLTCRTQDRFGGELRYIVIFSPDHASQAAITLGQERARREQAQVVYVGQRAALPDAVPVLTEEEFLARFGGPIDSLLALEESYADDLLELGENRLPKGKHGKASDMFELYVVAGLQFLIGRRVIHYGRRRSGERVPDGIALAGTTYALFDAKAAQNGFNFEADTIRQFASYADDFTQRYATLGAPYAFLCISGHFNDDDTAISGRAQTLYATAQTALVTLDARELGRAVNFFRSYLHLRQFADWKRLLATPVLRCSDIQAAARAAARDGLVEGAE